MSLLKAHYFTALLPPKDILEEVLRMKLALKDSFGIKHALKLPAHITLLPPFWLLKEQEEDLISALNVAKDMTKPFEVHLKGFGRFGNRVIFINVENPEPIEVLHQTLLTNCRHFTGAAGNGPIHPHMTIATRDLTGEKFAQVWPQFQDKNFSASFTATGFVLFRHNGKTWDIIKEFPLQ